MTGQNEHDFNEFESARRQKRARLCEAGIDPYGGRFDGAESLAAIPAGCPRIGTPGRTRLH